MPLWGDSDPPAPAGEQPDAAEPLPSRQPPTSRLELDGVPIFSDTPPVGTSDSPTTKLASSTTLPHSLLDYNDAKRGIEPPAERRAREQLTNRSR